MAKTQPILKFGLNGVNLGLFTHFNLQLQINKTFKANTLNSAWQIKPIFSLKLEYSIFFQQMSLIIETQRQPEPSD